jgi:hypothetical protein
VRRAAPAAADLCTAFFSWSCREGRLISLGAPAACAGRCCSSELYKTPRSFINTGMFKGVQQPLLTPLLTPEFIVATVWRAMLCGAHFVKAPWTIHLSMLLRGALPVNVFDLIAGHVFGAYSCMDTFIGKKTVV